jgi:hypothetical protein
MSTHTDTAVELQEYRVELVDQHGMLRDVDYLDAADHRQARTATRELLDAVPGWLYAHLYTFDGLSETYIDTVTRSYPDDLGLMCVDELDLIHRIVADGGIAEAVTTAQAALAAAQARQYDEECALHYAHQAARTASADQQGQADAWCAAADAQLHNAVDATRAAAARLAAAESALAARVNRAAPWNPAQSDLGDDQAEAVRDAANHLGAA